MRAYMPPTKSRWVSGYRKGFGCGVHRGKYLLRIVRKSFILIL